MGYEDLLAEIEKEGVELFENNYIGRIKGLYVDNTITLNTNIDTVVEKTCVLAEELGHHHTSYGNILDQSKLENRKQEKRARGWAYEKLVPIESFINASKQGLRNTHELAEYLYVSEQFLKDAIQYYEDKYGTFYEINDFIIYFNPLGVLEKIK